MAKSGTQTMMLKSVMVKQTQTDYSRFLAALVAGEVQALPNMAR